MSSENKISAEDRFRQAFERLKANQPKVLAQDAPVTQANVAREAGLDPSAFKKSRFPLLCSAVKSYGDNNVKAHMSKRKELLKRRNGRRKLKQSMVDIVLQRDTLQSQMASMHRRFVEITLELAATKEQLDATRASLTVLRR